MKIGFVVFNGVTWLDLIGVYDAVSRLRTMNYIPSLTWEICSFTDTAADPLGMEMIPTEVRQTLARFDAIIVPGGYGTRELQHDQGFITWLRTAEPVAQKISICTGSLLLGAAGFLKEKKATTNYNEYESLRPYCKEVIEARIVEDGSTITAGAVSASLDLGLYLCQKWSGAEAEKAIRLKMDYHG